MAGEDERGRELLGAGLAHLAPAPGRDVLTYLVEGLPLLALLRDRLRVASTTTEA